MILHTLISENANLVVTVCAALMVPVAATALSHTSTGRFLQWTRPDTVLELVTAFLDESYPTAK